MEKNLVDIKPISIQPNNSTSTTSNYDQENKKYHVLIMDDDPNFGEFLSIFLNLNGFNVELVDNPAKFWPVLQGKVFDVIFLDYRLPGTNGLQILSELSEKKYHIPVLMMTGEGDERIAAQAIQRGAFDYLVKGDNYLPNLSTLIHRAIRVNKLQQSVEASLEQIRYQATMLSNMRDAVVVWDTSGIITYWNPSAEMLFGFTTSEQTGKNVWEGYLNHFSPTLSAYDLLNSDNLETVRVYTTPKNKEIWISSRITPIHSSHSGASIIGYMDVARDISIQKQEQQELRDSRRFVQQILDTTPNILYIFDLTRDFCTFCNPHSQEILGYSLEEKQKEGFKIPFDFVHPEDMANVRKYFDSFSTLREGDVREISYRIRDQQGNWRWLECHDTAFLVDDDNIPVQIIGIAQDITERKEMEEKINLAQAYLTDSARLSAIGELASGVAHQISNPLTTVIAETQMLIQQLGKNHPLSESALAIEKAGWRAQYVVQQLLDYSQPTAETIISVNVNQTIQQAITLVGDNLTNAKISIEIELDQSILNVRAVPQRLVHVWVHLLLRAFHLLKETNSGIIKVSTQNDFSNHQILIVFADNSQMVSPDQISTIFEPILLPTSLNTGTGMELSICRETIRQFAGQITASLAGVWTEFRVILPGEKD